MRSRVLPHLAVASPLTVTKSWPNSFMKVVGTVADAVTFIVDVPPPV